MDWAMLSQYGLAGVLILLYVFKLQPDLLRAFHDEIAAEREAGKANIIQVKTAVDKLAEKIDRLMEQKS